jgi:hypothetical protein
MPEEYPGQSNDIIQALVRNRTTTETEESLMVQLYLLVNNLATYDHMLAKCSYKEHRDWERDSDEHVLHIWDIVKTAGLARCKTFFSTPNVAISAIKDRCLSSALRLGRLDFLEFVLDSGVDVKSPVPVPLSLDGEYPLQLAADIDDEETSQQAVLMLLQRGAVPEPNKHRSIHHDNPDQSPLGSAIRLEHWAVAETLIAAGAPASSDAVWHALADGHEEMCLRLLDAGGDPDAANCGGLPGLFQKLTLLGLAVEKGDLEMAEALVARGANVNALQEFTHSALLPGHVNELQATTPLGLAAREGNLEMCGFLLQSGADINIPTFGEIPKKRLSLREPAACSLPPFNCRMRQWAHGNRTVSCGKRSQRRPCRCNRDRAPPPPLERLQKGNSSRDSHQSVQGLRNSAIRSRAVQIFDPKGRAP